MDVKELYHKKGVDFQMKFNYSTTELIAFGNECASQSLSDTLDKEMKVVHGDIRAKNIQNELIVLVGRIEYYKKIGKEVLIDEEFKVTSFKILRLLLNHLKSLKQ